MSRLECFEVELPPDLAQFVHAQVRERKLASESELFQEAMRQAAQTDANRASIRQKIAAGVASLQAGRGIDGAAFMAAIDIGLAEQETREG